jgi:hypothetical protein
MIVSRLTDGPGNQMFQYAAGRRLAHHHGTDLILDMSWYASQPSASTPRRYEPRWTHSSGMHLKRLFVSERGAPL